MEFHNYFTLRDFEKRSGGKHSLARDQECFYRMLTLDSMLMGSGQLWAQGMSELEWERLRRPYYNIYPGIIPMLIRLNLTAVDSSLIRLPMRSLCIRLPKEPGKNPLTFDWMGQRIHLHCFAAHQN